MDDETVSYVSCQSFRQDDAKHLDGIHTSDNIHGVTVNFLMLITNSSSPRLSIWTFQLNLR